MTRSPWWWIPSLYYGQGLPYVVVMTLAVVLYKNLGLDNTAIALYTSWLYLPWVIKPLWSPLVDIVRTKRWWIVSLQLFIGAALAMVALTLPMPGFFQLSLALFWLMTASVIQGFEGLLHGNVLLVATMPMVMARAPTAWDPMSVCTVRRWTCCKSVIGCILLLAPSQV